MGVSLVTGGAGFIGSHLVEALLKQGHQLRVLDDLRTGTLANLSTVLDEVEVIQGTVEDLDAVRRAMERVELVFHFTPPVVRNSRGAEKPSAIDDGTMRVLIAARESDVRRLVYASTTRVYGHAPGSTFTEADPPHPISSYATAKLCGEQDCTSFTHLYGLETVRLRFAEVFGPRQVAAQSYTKLVPYLIQTFLTGQRPILPREEPECQDLLYVDDAVRAALLASDAPQLSGHVFNIGRGRCVTTSELLQVLNRIFGSHVVPLHTAPPPPLELNNRADITRARVKLGFHPGTDLEVQLARCVLDCEPRGRIPSTVTR
jgi:UDP-glucose 4-epimerase